MNFDEWWSKHGVYRFPEPGKSLANAVWNAATKAEREACALACDARRIAHVQGDWDRGYNMALQDCNAAILAR